MFNPGLGLLRGVLTVDSSCQQTTIRETIQEVGLCEEF
jgi:hypothetical protein